MSDHENADLVEGLEALLATLDSGEPIDPESVRELLDIAKGGSGKVEEVDILSDDDDDDDYLDMLGDEEEDLDVVPPVGAAPTMKKKNPFAALGKGVV